MCRLTIPNFSIVLRSSLISKSFIYNTTTTNITTYPLKRQALKKSSLYINTKIKTTCIPI
jgi:hypothetical protein